MRMQLKLEQCKEKKNKNKKNQTTTSVKHLSQQNSPILIVFSILAKIGIFHFSEMGKCIMQTSLVFLIKLIFFLTNLKTNCSEK